MEEPLGRFNFCSYHVNSLEKKKEGRGAVRMLALCLQVLYKKRKEMYDSHRPPSQRTRTKYNNPFLLWRAAFELYANSWLLEILKFT